MITTRRSFCSHACQAASLAAAGAILSGCGSSDSNPASPSNVGGSGGGTTGGAPLLAGVSSSVIGRTVSVTVTGTNLQNVGSPASTDTPIGSFLITQTSQDVFSVLTATCTHEACTINGFANARFVCPCHGSQFSTSGSVLNGPAAVSLRSFASSLSNGVLTFTA